MNGHPVTEGLARFWTTGTAVLLLVLAFGIVTQPGFPLGLGPIRTTGRAGLWVTLAPALVGLVGLLLVRKEGRLGPGLVLAYSAFWSVVMAAALPSVWNAKKAFCLDGPGFCITSPWIGRTLALGVLSAFVLVAVWAWQRVAERWRTTDK